MNIQNTIFHLLQVVASSNIFIIYFIFDSKHLFSLYYHIQRNRTLPHSITPYMDRLQIDYFFYIYIYLFYFDRPSSILIKLLQCRQKKNRLPICIAVRQMYSYLPKATFVWINVRIVQMEIQIRKQKAISTILIIFCSLFSINFSLQNSPVRACDLWQTSKEKFVKSANEWMSFNWEV